jgi:hypothetical protein
MTAEHLAAITLRTRRAKDHSRVLQFIEQDAVDKKKLRSILRRHGLASKWKQFEHKLPGGKSMSKPKLQARMRALSLDEKIKILEKLPDRSIAIAASG